MSATAILVSTILLVLCLLAVALLTGSLALLSAGHQEAAAQRGGLLEALRLLDRQWQIERLVYRHHRLFGLLVLAAGIFCVWQMTRAELIGLLDGDYPTSVLMWMLLLAQAFNLLVGLIIFFRPSLLKPVEALSNRWHHLNTSGEGPPSAIRLKAALLALIGLVVLLGSAALLFQQVSGIAA